MEGACKCDRSCQFTERTGTTAFLIVHQLLILNSYVVLFSHSTVYRPNQESRGGDDVFLASFNTERGDLLYLRQAGSSHNDASAKHNPVLADKDNYAVIVGTIESVEASDVFVLQYDPNGVEGAPMAVPEDKQVDEDEVPVTIPTPPQENSGYYTASTPEEQPEAALQASNTAPATTTARTSNQQRSATANGLIAITVISCLIVVVVSMFVVRDRYFATGRDDIRREQAIHDAIEANCSSPRRSHEYDIDSFFPRRVVPGGGEEDQNENGMEQYDFSGSAVISGSLDTSLKVHDVPNLDIAGTTRSNYHELLRAYSTYNIHDDGDDMEYDDNTYSDEDDHDPLPPGMPSVV
jgi:hypothetical protein